MMFYRKDILQELGLEVPQTWDDVKEMISVLSKNNMRFGMLPQPVQGATTQATDSTYGIFLYQNGGSFYNTDATASGLDTDIAINAFKEWTKYYTDYSLEREYDFVSRFRTGEMPIGIADYGTYNTLQVSAPEINGAWGFSAIPGTKKADGTVDHSVPSNGSAVIIMEHSRDKEAAWEYLKWWTSAEVQTKYGLEMEGLMGASARYPTANKEALASLPWPRNDYKILSGQFKDVKGVPQVPGGYYTSRYIYNAFTEVVVNKDIGPREALMDNVQYINDEIKNKRKEFGLDN
jgi:ABC-type glycerol-3-phosphate transport system substrate-binding protein